jgi:rod shape-determining protein MreC
MIRLWDKIRDWVLLLTLLFLSVSVLLSVNDPMVRGFRARALETTGSVEGWFTWLGNYFRAADENESLRSENHRLSSELARAREATAVNEQLRAMLGLRDSMNVDIVSARIISKDITHERNFMVLDVGTADGIRENMAVVDARGILGKTVLVEENYVKVMTYLNSEFTIPVKLSASNSDGIIRWDGEQYDRLIVDLVPKSQEIEDGEFVVTSGYSGIFQPGYPVGEITEHIELPGMITWQIFVRPFARLDNASHAFVIRTIPQPETLLSDS